ncbi:hypothetical protein [Pseudobacteriovorax antillogorgiicola]|uniref:Uncharacterized protein n=1 Tax=Pseudobacteriovorax antillogorgiicola TaxID=1513793 RepID=A0A1Y6C3F6_9BACT|nr:hypothetical protein [Pseudobacteriovorax antillogorgiicola]TCS50756.1 hypothetical protein EDD56_112139 [Pseudobacteriovorax antillogorgiicola]SMF41141.1 hypothetical protein SAMN06296036_112138 [Pseudobacteriovorax antillogorgiicola]
MAIGIIAATLLAGLTAADFTITIGEMATQGSFIDPHIDDRIQVLNMKHLEATSLQTEFIDTLRKVQSQAQSASISINFNRQSLQNVEKLFSYIPELPDEHQGLPDFSTNNEALNYILGSQNTLLRSFPKDELVKYFRKAKSFAQRLNQITLEYLGLDELSLQGKQVLTVAGALKQPTNIKNLKVLKASLKTRMNAALSVASITSQVYDSVQRRKEIEARIKGLQNIIDLLHGRLLPKNESYKEDVDESIQEAVISLPELRKYQDQLREIKDWDLRVYRNMAEYFFNSYQSDDDKLQILQSSENELRRNSFHEIYLYVSESGDLSSADQITWDRMRGQQVKLVPFLINANLDVITLSVTLPEDFISERNRNRIHEMCRLFGSLGLETVYEQLTDTFDISEEMASKVIQNDLNDHCG